MAIYPKQLQHFDPVTLATGPGGSKIRDTSFSTKLVLTDGAILAEAYTVNGMIRFLEKTYYNTAVDYVRSEPRFRPFDSSFGDVEMYASGPVTGDVTVAGAIDKMRTLWDTDRAVTPNSIGYATSVQN